MKHIKLFEDIDFDENDFDWEDEIQPDRDEKYHLNKKEVEILSKRNKLGILNESDLEKLDYFIFLKIDEEDYFLKKLIKEGLRDYNEYLDIKRNIENYNQPLKLTIARCEGIVNAMIGVLEDWIS